MSLLTLIGFPLYKLFRFLTVPGRMMQIKKGQFAIATAIIVTVVGLILFVPWPHYIKCRVLMIPNRLETIYAREGGVVRKLYVQPGTNVTPGQLLAELKTSNSRWNWNRPRAAWKKFSISAIWPSERPTWTPAAISTTSAKSARSIPKPRSSASGLCCCSRDSGL